MIKFVCDLWQVGGFLRLLWFPSANAVYTRLWSRGRQVEPPCRLQFGSFLGGSLLVVTRYVAALGWVQLEVTVSSWWFSLVPSVVSGPFFSGGSANAVEIGPFSGRNGCRSGR